MFIALFFYILLVFQDSNAEERRCSLIIPKKSSECKLSEEDKKSIFKYTHCCFKKDNSTSSIRINSCKAKTEDEYQKMIANGEKCYNEENPDPRELSGCESKTPSKPSDCVLSNEEKDQGYEHCCYEVFEGEKECSLFTKEEYKLELELFKIFADKETDVLQCGGEDNENGDYKFGAGLVYLSITSFLLLILNL